MVDSHCHLDMLAGWRAPAPLAQQDRLQEQDEIMARARQAGVRQLVVPGCSWSDFPAVREVAERFADAWLAFGIHPHDASTWEDRPEQRLTTELAHARAVAIGECGLDYHYDLSPRDRQRAAFRAQIRLARELGKPLIVHTREAQDDTAQILAEEGAAEVKGVLHCFTGGLELANKALDMGFYISFSGVLTFARSGDLRAVAAEIPLERTLVETDAPYLAPLPYRGKRNEPAFVVRVVETLAEIHGLAPRTIGDVTGANARQLFGLPQPRSPG